MKNNAVILPLNIIRENGKDSFYNLIETIKDGIYISDLQGCLLFVNQSFADMLGFDNKEDLIGVNLGKDIYLNPNHRIVFIRHLKKFGFVKDYEIQLIKKNGDIVIVSATSNLIYDKKNNLIGVEGVIRDVTERNNWEKELELLQGTLMLKQHKLEQVLNIDQKISSILDINHLVDFVIKRAVDILDAEKCSLMLIDEDTDELIIRGSLGIDSKIIKKNRIRIGDPLAGRVAKHGKPILINDIEHNQIFTRRNRSHYKTKSFLIVPIVVHGKIIGVVNVTEKNPHSLGTKIFTEVDLKILCTIVRQAAIAIENANYFRELTHLSISDPLTGLFNHRYFIRALDREINRIDRYPKPLCLNMIDIDDFKKYNDDFGHLDGDLLLKTFSGVLNKACRKVDFVCRYAGDEFVVILPETDMNNALIVAKKMQVLLKQIKSKRPVSISIGIAKHAKNMTRRDLILKADQALYQAKSEGKNRFVSL